MLSVITVFYNFYKVAYNVRCETTSSPALIFDYNERLSTECVSFRIIFRKKTDVSFKSQMSLFPLSKTLQNSNSINTNGRYPHKMTQQY